MNYKEEYDYDDELFYQKQERPLCCHCDDPIFEEFICFDDEVTCLECLENMSTRQLLEYLTIDVNRFSFYG